MFTTSSENHWIFSQVCQELLAYVEEQVVTPILQSVPFFAVPSDIERFKSELMTVIRWLGQSSPLVIDGAMAAFIKAAVILKRRQLANQVEEQQAHVTNPEVLAALDE